MHVFIFQVYQYIYIYIHYLSFTPRQEEVGFISCERINMNLNLNKKGRNTQFVLMQLYYDIFQFVIMLLLPYIPVYKTHIFRKNLGSKNCVRLIHGQMR